MPPAVRVRGARRTFAAELAPVRALRVGAAAPEERVVVGRARSGGPRRMSVWLLAPLAEHAGRHGDGPARAVPVVHGVHPPLLHERGLGEALRTAAVRSPLPCAVEVDLPGRYLPDVEACVYFCCREAVQNAGKHAGPGSAILVRVHSDGDGRRFEVGDDGAGLAADAAEGHGFVNMRDRLGAVGGRLRVRAEPGAGTTVTGRVPA